MGHGNMISVQTQLQSGHPMTGSVLHLNADQTAVPTIGYHYEQRYVISIGEYTVCTVPSLSLRHIITITSMEYRRTLHTDPWAYISSKQWSSRPVHTGPVLLTLRPGGLSLILLSCRPPSSPSTYLSINP